MSHEVMIAKVKEVLNQISARFLEAGIEHEIAEGNTYNNHGYIVVYSDKTKRAHTIYVGVKGNKPSSPFCPPVHWAARNTYVGISIIVDGYFSNGWKRNASIFKQCKNGTYNLDGVVEKIQQWRKDMQQAKEDAHAIEQKMKVSKHALDSMRANFLRSGKLVREEATNASSVPTTFSIDLRYLPEAKARKILAFLERI